MKNSRFLFLFLFAVLFLGLKLEAQSESSKLNQNELMKKFVGLWYAEGTNLTPEIRQFGARAYEGYQKAEYKDSKLKLILAFSALNTFNIVSNLASVRLFSIFEICAFFTPTSCPSSSCVKCRSFLACLIARPITSRRSSYSNSSLMGVPGYR